MVPEPTKRFVLDPIRTCNIKCKFCYHLHTYNSWDNYTWSMEKVAQTINEGLSRGNNYMDITGGEPTLYPKIEEVIQYGLKRGIKTCIITNATTSPKKAKRLIEAGIDDFLISRQGLEATHDFVTNNPGGYQRQLKFIKAIESHLRFRFNVVLHHWNQHEIYTIAKILADYNPKIVNFINMNPHEQWLQKELATREVIADLSFVQPVLEEAVRYLEDLGIGVNIRYYPMCCIAEEFRKNICNDLHVTFDPYEWDYNIQPKTYAAHYAWGKNTSNNIELKIEPCKSCDLQWICGGINKAYFKASGGKYIKPVEFEGKKDDFYYYRKHNLLGMEV